MGTEVRKRIAIDVDDTISQTDARFHEILNSEIALHGHDEYLLNRFKYDEVLKESMRTAKPFDGAVDFCQYLKDRNYHVVILTAREEKNYKQITKDWLNDNQFVFDEVVHDHKKDKYCLNNNVRVLIDDTWEHLAFAEHRGIQGYLKTKLKSLSDTKIIPFDTFDELKQYF